MTTVSVHAMKKLVSEYLGKGIVCAPSTLPWTFLVPTSHRVPDLINGWLILPSARENCKHDNYMDSIQEIGETALPWYDYFCTKHAVRGACR